MNPNKIYVVPPLQKSSKDLRSQLQWNKPTTKLLSRMMLSKARALQSAKDSPSRLRRTTSTSIVSGAVLANPSVCRGFFAIPSFSFWFSPSTALFKGLSPPVHTYIHTYIHTLNTRTHICAHVVCLLAWLSIFSPATKPIVNSYLLKRNEKLRPLKLLSGDSNGKTHRKTRYKYNIYLSSAVLSMFWSIESKVRNA